jgi:hypothetical protein
MLTKTQIGVLVTLKEAEEREDRGEAIPEDYSEAEIVCDGLTCYLGDRPISWRTVKALLEVVAISDRSITGDSGRIFMINDVGRSITRRPELADEVAASLYTGQSVTIIDDRIVPLKD